jgi:hypothetical protein
MNVKDLSVSISFIRFINLLKPVFAIVSAHEIRLEDSVCNWECNSSSHLNIPKTSAELVRNNPIPKD